MPTDTDKTIKKELEAVSHLATFLYRGLGFRQLSQTKSIFSIVTQFSNERQVVVYTDNALGYFVTCINGNQTSSVSIKYSDPFARRLRSIQLPISPDSLDELNLKKDQKFTDSFIGHAFLSRAGSVETEHDNINTEEIQLLNKVNIGLQNVDQMLMEKTNKLKSTVYTIEELDVLVYKLIKPKVGGELLFPPQLKDDSIEEKKRLQKAKKRAEQREKRQREQESKAKVTAPQTDDYPIFTPRPLSGFE